MAEQQDDDKAENGAENGEKKTAQAPSGDNITKLGSDIEIITDQPLPHLNSGELKAYAARMTNGKNCFAIVCENYLVPRTFLTSKFSQLANMNIVRIIASGVVYWPSEGRQRYVFVYEDTLGKPILPADQTQALGMKHERLMNAIIKPLVILMLELRDADLVHGGIRATNIFDGNAQNFDNIILGEALSAPPTYHQPAIYMPIEKAMVPPVARGLSSFSDDIFALGVTILTLMRKDDPFTKMTDEDIIRQRIEHGTYSFFTTHQRNTGPLMELIRGMLHDDWQQRWTIEEVLAWMDGKRLSPKKGATARVKASRAYDFSGEKIIRPELLSYEFQFDQKTAKETVLEGSFATWVERSLGSDLILDNVHKAEASAREGGKNADFKDRYLSKVMNALYPKSPIIYKNIKTMPEGMGYLTANLFGNLMSTTAVHDILRYNLIGYWCSIAEDTEFDVTALHSKFDSARVNAVQNKLGLGLEGNLYFLCGECPCLSQNVSLYYVRSPEDLLLAFEDTCSRSHKTDGFMDKHIAGFLMARDKKVIERELNDLDSNDMFSYKRALLTVFANIQERGRMSPLPNLSKAMVTYLAPILDRFHDRDKRKEIRERVDAIADSGNLVKMARTINDLDVRKKDTNLFKRAMHEHKLLKGEQEYLQEQLEFNPKFGQGTGYEIAAIVSGVIAAIIILASTFLQYSKGDIF